MPDIPAFGQINKDSTVINKIILDGLTDQASEIFYPDDITLAELNENLNRVFPKQASTAPMSLFGSFAVSGDTYYVEYGQKLLRWKPSTTEWYDTGLMDKKRLPFPFDPSKPNDNPTGISPFLVSPDSMSFKIAVSSNTVYVGKRDGHLMESLDGGDSWNDLTDQLPFPIKSYKSIVFAGQTVYAATDKGVVRSRNGIVWWTLLDVEGTNLVMDNLAVEGTTVYGQSGQQVYQLNENSSTWKQITPEIPYSVTCLTVDDNTLYVGTLGGGVLRFSLDN